MLRCVCVCVCAPGDIILYSGDMGREMYCIKRGYVEVCVCVCVPLGTSSCTAGTWGGRCTASRGDTLRCVCVCVCCVCVCVVCVCVCVCVCVSVCVCAPGDIILYSGDMGREMYCIKRGYVEVCVCVCV